MGKGVRLRSAAFRRGQREQRAEAPNAACTATADGSTPRTSTRAMKGGCAWALQLISSGASATDSLGPAQAECKTHARTARRRARRGIKPGRTTAPAFTVALVTLSRHRNQHRIYGRPTARSSSSMSRRKRRMKRRRKSRRRRRRRRRSSRGEFVTVCVDKQVTQFCFNFHLFCGNRR